MNTGRSRVDDIAIVLQISSELFSSHPLLVPRALLAAGALIISQRTGQRGFTVSEMGRDIQRRSRVSRVFRVIVTCSMKWRTA